MTTEKYDISDGWISVADQPPPYYSAIWLWEPESNKSRYVPETTPRYTVAKTAFWKPVISPQPPRLKTPEEIERELERKAIVDWWRKLGVDFAEYTWDDVRADWIEAWRAGRDWQKARENTES